MLTDPVPFTVESLGLASLEEKDREGLLKFQKKAGELQRAMMGAAAAVNEALRNLEFMKQAIADTPKDVFQLDQEVRSLEKRLRDAMTRLAVDETVQRRSEPTLPSLRSRVRAQILSTTPITPTLKRDYEIAAEAFEKLLEDIRVLVEVDLKRLGEQLEDAGAPWTPGRRVPRWKR